MVSSRHKESLVDGDCIVLHRELECVDYLNITTILCAKQSTDHWATAISALFAFKT